MIRLIDSEIVGVKKIERAAHPFAIYYFVAICDDCDCGKIAGSFFGDIGAYCIADICQVAFLNGVWQYVK